MGKKGGKRGFQALAGDEVARLTFLGATGEVTGSSYLLETERARILVECGMFQGDRRSRTQNARSFAFEPQGLDAVVLTHAHIDHSGLLPKLVREGFRGAVHLTAAGEELTGLLLRDSAHIHEQDTSRENRRRRRAGKSTVEPLYGGEDAERAVKQMEPHAFDEMVEVKDGVRVRFRRAGHILGASSVECWVRRGTVERKVVFSGDVGRQHEPLLLPPEPPDEADLVLLESTYGDRDHRGPKETLDELAETLNHAVKDGGNVIVPVFAVGRAQEILHAIGLLEDEGRIPELPVFLDSPMAIHATALYRRWAHCFQADGDCPREAREPAKLAFCRTPDESMRLNDRRGVVILSASGMCEGGRVMHHLKHHLWRESTDVVIVGFQARGTLGRALVEGARSVRIYGETIAVKARVHTIGGFSAHAGQGELVRWVTAMAKGGARVALVHGEDDRRMALASKLTEALDVEPWLPRRKDRAVLKMRGEKVELVRG